MRQSRIGFTLIEMMMVVVIMGVMLAFGLPKFNSLRNSGKIGSAKVHLTSSVVTARAAAIQKGRPARWSLASNEITVAADTGNGIYVVISRAKFDSLYAVRVAASQNSIDFDSRGLASNLSSTVKVYVRGTTTDSVCITRLGVVIRNGCL